MACSRAVVFSGEEVAAVVKWLKENGSLKR
jgi:hypothetical protein